MSTSRFSNLQAFVLVTLMIDAAVPGVRAAERRPWPKIELVTTDGSPVASDRVARSGTWVVIYVSSDCAACESVLKSVKRLGEGAARVVIVVAGDAQAAATLAAAHSTTAGVTWLADPTQALAAGLRIESLPTVVGVHDRTIEWSLGGVLTDTTEVGTVLASWLAR